VLIFENDFAPLVEHIRKACPEIARYAAVTEAGNGAGPLADFTYEELLTRGRMERPDIFSFDENAIAELFYTSGSTGTPKGVMLSHRTLYLHALAVAGTFNHDDTAVELHTIPLFHANGWGRPQASTMMGLKQVMVRRFEPTLVFRLIQEEKATAMSLASPELIGRLEGAFHCPAMGGYGLTETCPVASSARPKGTVEYADEADRLGRQATAGWPIPGVEIRVVDLDMKDVPRDMQTVGEVAIRGDEVMDGYYKDPQGTAAVMTDGWFHSGDMAVWDEENYIHIVDRKKDIIISGGENISSLEVEKAIFAHPAVLECAVVAAPDDKWGEIPAAFVVLKPGQTLQAEQLCAFLAGRIARFKIPRTFAFTETPLPKTGTGKIVKRELRDMLWAGRAKRVQG